MQKLIVSSFDNCLINDEEEIPVSTVMLIDDLRRKNNKFAVITSRCLKSILDYNRDFPFIDYIICANASYIYDSINEKVIYKKNILFSNIKKIVKEFYNEAIIYLVDDYRWNLINEADNLIRLYDFIKIQDYTKFIENNKTNIYKIELYFQELAQVKKAIKKLNSFNLKINVNSKIDRQYYVIEITHIDVNKLDSLKKIAPKLNLDNVIAFGYEDSDIPIIENVGLGIALENASKGIKKKAKFITEDCNHKGIEKYLKNYFYEK